MKTLCILYNETAETLASHWYSFVSKKKKSVSVPSLVLLEQLEQNVLKKSYAAQITLTNEKAKEDQFVKNTTNLNSSKEINILAEYGVKEIKNVCIFHHRSRGGFIA